MKDSKTPAILLDPYLNLLGHVVGVSAQDEESGRPDIWTCSCGVRGDADKVAEHIAEDVSAQIAACLADAKNGGIMRLRRDGA